MGQCLKPSYHPSVLRGMVNIELTPLLGEWGTHGLAGTWLPWDQFSAKAAHLRVPTPEPGGPGHASPGISVLWPFSPFGRLEKQPLYPKEKGRTIRSSHWTPGHERSACLPAHSLTIYREPRMANNGEEDRTVGATALHMRLWEMLLTVGGLRLEPNWKKQMSLVP